MTKIECVKMISEKDMVFSNGKIYAKTVITSEEDSHEWREIAIEENIKNKIMMVYIQK